MEIKQAILIPILVGVLEVIKRSGFPAKLIPGLAVVLGIGLGIVYSGFELEIGVIYGVGLGLSAIGLYSGSTNLYEGIQEIRKNR